MQYETLIPPSNIDFALQRRWYQYVGEDACDDVLVYLPRKQASWGFAEELEGYFAAAMMATYLDKAMVIVEQPPPEGKGKRGPSPITLIEEGGGAGTSWLDCPAETFLQSNSNKDGGDAEEERGQAVTEEDLPTGLSRLIQHPSWLSRGCPV